MTTSIALSVGDPEKDPASFTRFVLPFGYRLEPAGAADGPVWRPDRRSHGDPQREAERYFTIETARVLYRRTARFELENEGDLPRLFEVPRRQGTGSYLLQIAPPRLVLFEWPEGRPGAPRPRRSEDLLATGFLVVEISFPSADQAPDLDELLELNEVFRHCVPPFPEHVDDGTEGGGRRGLRTVLGDLSLDLGQSSARIRDATSNPSDLQAFYFDRWASLLERPLEQQPGERWRLFPATWSQRASSWYRQPLAEQGNGWVVYTDSRAFVWTCALVPDGVGGVARRLGVSPLPASSLGHWCRLLNVDAPGTRPAEATDFVKSWTEDRTYHRWEEFGTVYGFAYHGGALLSSPMRDVPLWRHFGGMYFDQTLLLLYLRVSSFRFSRRLSEMTEQARGGGPGESEAWQRRFQTLRRDFAFFTNLYQFPLLSNQQQGVELYELARRYLDVNALFSEIQSEVESTHEYFQIEVAHDHSQTATRLTVVATAGLLLSVVAGFFGMNFLVPDRDHGWGDKMQLFTFSVGFVLVGLLFGLVSRFPRKVDRCLSLRWWGRQGDDDA